MLFVLLDAHNFTMLVPFFTVLMLLTCAQRDSTTCMINVDELEAADAQNC